MRRARLGIVVLMLLHTPLLAPWCRPLPDGAGAGGTPAAPRPMLPAWRFQFAPLYSYDSGPAVGLYRRVARRWDWGVQFGDAFLDGKTENDRSASSAGSTDLWDRDHVYVSTSFTLTSELRRWWRRTEALSIFGGLRAMGTYGKGRTEEEDYDLRVRTGETEQRWDSDADRWESYGTGVGMLVGADLKLIEHLSMTVVMVPARVEAVWSRGRASWRSTEREGGVVNRDEGKDRTWSVQIESRWTLSPRLFLSLAL